MKKSYNKTILTVFTLLLTTSVLFGCVERGQDSMEDIATKQQQAILAQKTYEERLKKYGKEITLEKVDTTNWRTYTDAKRGFSFQYPQDWVVTEVPYVEPETYKDCHDVLGGTGLCDDYMIKSMINETPLLHVHPKNSNTEDDRTITFKELTPKIMHIPSVWDLYVHNYKTAEDFKYQQYNVTATNAVMRSSNTMLEYFRFGTYKGYLIEISHSVEERGGECNQVSTGYSAYEIAKKHGGGCFIVSKELEQPYFSILQTLQTHQPSPSN